MEKTLVLGKTEGKGERGGRGWNSYIHDSVDMNLSKLQETVKGRGAWCAEVLGVPKTQTQPRTEQQQQIYNT